MTSDLNQSGGVTRPFGSAQGRPVGSVIIPTYNRSDSLARALRSLARLDFPRDQWQVVVVDNNSTDDTKQVAEAARSSMALNLKYVREERLSFTVARHTGAAAAEGDILLYIDDDVTVETGWMKAVVEGFQRDPKTGMVAGPIKPIFEVAPPEWILKMDDMDGVWLSLFDCGNEIREVPGALGPNLCIRKSLFDEVGGFPPDTIGVEAEGKPGTVEKIYIGPGDWGLSQKVRAAGFKIIYIPDAMVYHHIPPVRMTKRWWHSRLAGEGCYHAITDQHEHHQETAKLRLRALVSLAWVGVMALLWIAAPLRGKPTKRYVFRISYYLSRMKTELALARRPDLADRLWEIGLSGVLSDDYRQLLRLLP